MIKDKNNKVVVYWIAGSAGVCPKCGNHNAMLDSNWSDAAGHRYEDLECRDCHYLVKDGDYVNVTIHMDTTCREYYGIAADGVKVYLASFEGTGLMRYLKHHPTPDTW